MINYKLVHTSFGEEMITRYMKTFDFGRSSGSTTGEILLKISNPEKKIATVNGRPEIIENIDIII